MLYLLMFLLKYLGCDTLLLFSRRRCYPAAFFLMKNGLLKGQVSNFPPCCINNYLTNLLLSSHTRQYYFRYGIDEFLGL